MKKVLSLFLSLVLMLSLFACGGDKPAESGGPDAGPGSISTGAPETDKVTGTPSEVPSEPAVTETVAPAPAVSEADEALAAFDAFISALKAVDIETASMYLDGDKLSEDDLLASLGEDDTLSEDAMMRLVGVMFGALDYEVSRVDAEDGVAVIEAVITNRDFETALANATEDVLLNAFALIAEMDEETIAGMDEDEFYEYFMELLVDMMIDLMENCDAMRSSDVTVFMVYDEAEGIWKVDMTDELSDAILGGAGNDDDDDDSGYGFEFEVDFGDGEIELAPGVEWAEGDDDASDAEPGIGGGFLMVGTVPPVQD